MSERIQRGHAHKATVVAVADRQWSDPIPDEYLPLFETAGIVLDDNDHNVIAYHAGRKCGAVWGPAVEGHWFAYREGTDPVRVSSRNDGLRHLLGLDTEAVVA